MDKSGFGRFRPVLSRVIETGNLITSVIILDMKAIIPKTIQYE